MSSVARARQQAPTPGPASQQAPRGAGLQFRSGSVNVRPALSANHASALFGKSAMFVELVEVVGHAAATQLVAAFGGTRLYVPHTPVPDDALSLSIGLEAAIKLSQVYGGDRLDVPNPTPRRAQICLLWSDGLTVDQIARRLKCTRRRVFQVLAEARASAHFD